MKRVTIKVTAEAADMLKKLAIDQRSSVAAIAGKIIESSPEMRGGGK